MRGAGQEAERNGREKKGALQNKRLQQAEQLCVECKRSVLDGMMAYIEGLLHAFSLCDESLSL